MESKLVKNQKKTITKTLPNLNVFDIQIRYDDKCGNGHNTFAITGTLHEKLPRRDKNLIVCGCVHDEIIKHAPEYAHLIKWHHMSSDEPMFYLANTLYHVENREFDKARRCAIWPEATDEELTSDNLKELLVARLPNLIEEFKRVVESLGFVY